VLRGWEERDREPWRALCADPDVMRWIWDGRPLDPDAADARVEAYKRCWRDEGFGLWALEDRALGRCIGFCGLLRLPGGGVEIGWRLERAAWGKGYATEAALVARDWAFASITGLDELFALFQAGNDASRRVMDKLGMSFVREETNEWDRVVSVYSITSPASG
jgi:RimJ/RimL family protein N-acetyltransferase